MMHGYPVMQVVQYSVPPPCSWGPPIEPHRPPPPLQTSVPYRSGVRKYVVWCLVCGSLSCMLGIMFLGVYFLVRSYTSTVGYFETVPTFVPATLLMLTGLCIMSLARRRNRYSYLIKLSGACGLSSALTCALVTVTTTIIHMSRLQALRECEYTKKTRTCTCYSIETHAMQDDNGNIGGNDEIGYRFVFDSADECTIVHNALYSCLRAIFGISVAGVLVAVFSCMLVYQLLSHERKKMIWEQLELRRRQAYGRQSPPGWPSLANGPSIIDTPRNGACRCCEQCHSHRNTLQPNYAWDGDNRFWPGGYYAPTHNGDEHMIVSRMMNQNSMQSQRPGWSWPRFPWQRNDSQRFRQTPSSPDSQYGFTTNLQRLDNPNMMQGYTLINGAHQFGVWGPPPPYSDPNSPVRRSRYQYNHPNQCQQIVEHPNVVIQTIPSTQQQPIMTQMECNQHTVIDNNNHHSVEQMCLTPSHNRHRTKHRLNALKIKDSHESTMLPDSDNLRENQSNTLPFRKARRKIENGKMIPTHQSVSRISVQNVFGSTQNIATANRIDTIQRENMPSCSNSGYSNQKTKDSNGIDNSAFQSVEDDRIIDASQSEEYSTGLGQIVGSRDVFVRTRLHFPNQDYEKLNAVETNDQLLAMSPRNHCHSLPKDLTRHSICSVDSGEKTDYTDLSPMTPSTPYSNTDALNAFGVMQIEMKQEQQLSHFSDPSGSNHPSMYRYCDDIHHNRDRGNRTQKNHPEIRLRTAMQHSDTSTNRMPAIGYNGAASLDNLSLNTTISPYQKFERHNVYQRPTYSFASAHSTPGHSHSRKQNATPNKRRVHATQSLTISNSTCLSETIDINAETFVRLENVKTDNSAPNGQDAFDNDSSHSKTLSENNDWSDHSSGDMRL